MRRNRDRNREQRTKKKGRDRVVTVIVNGTAIKNKTEANVDLLAREKGS
jgi:hypothetical protein